MRTTLMRTRYPVVIATLALFAACAAAPGGQDVEDAAILDPEVLLANGDAALERNELPEAALSYRRAAEASEDEAVAEQATRTAFDHSQMQEAALAADRRDATRACRRSSCTAWMWRRTTSRSYWKPRT
jgi:hypothetical protein